MRALLVAAAAACFAPAACAGVMMQAFYWDVPSPAAGNADAAWWWDHIAKQADGWATAGFGSVWIPPVTKGASGGYSVGYDPFDDYDIGSKLQKGTLPTRYGTRDQLQRMAATMRACGLDLYLDIVANHRNGDPGDSVFTYLDAYGRQGGGRFQKYPEDFHPNVPQDPNVPAELAQFGRDVAHINGTEGRIGRGITEATGWLTRALDAKGYRLDYVKGISCDWLRQMLDTPPMKGKFAVAEFWDADDLAVADYVQSCMGGRVSGFDFPLRFVLRDMCASGGKFDMRKLHRAGYAGRDAARSVTFVDNHDTAREDEVPDKELAYAYILTSEGTPCVFYRDYSTDAGCLGMKPQIDRLIWIHNNLASGATRERWKSDDVFCFERDGGRRLLVALNDNPSEPQTITPATGFGEGVRLKDYSGHAPDVVTGKYGVVKMTVPANVSGSGYVCYSVAGARGAAAGVRAYDTTQVYEGASDLDIKPADPSAPSTVCRIWPAAGTPVRISASVDRTGWSDKTSVTFVLLGGKQKKLAELVICRNSKTGEVAARAPGGVCEVVVRAATTPLSHNRCAFKLQLTYRGESRPAAVEPAGR